MTTEASRNYDRLRDDEWHDEVRIETVPRYKTSGLSGDEWRTSVCVTILRKGNLLLERTFGDMACAAACLPYLMIVFREEFEYQTVHTSLLCMQPGCSNPWSKLYRKKADYCIHTARPRPIDEGYPKYRAFCGEHEMRGDCGTDDADRNYEPVEIGGASGV